MTQREGRCGGALSRSVWLAGLAMVLLGGVAPLSQAAARTGTDPSVREVEEPQDDPVGPRQREMVRRERYVELEAQVVADAVAVGKQLDLVLFDDLTASIVPYVVERPTADTVNVAFEWADGISTGFLYVDRGELDFILETPDATYQVLRVDGRRHGVFEFEPGAYSLDDDQADAPASTHDTTAEQQETAAAGDGTFTTTSATDGNATWDVLVLYNAIAQQQAGGDMEEDAEDSFLFAGNVIHDNTSTGVDYRVVGVVEMPFAESCGNDDSQNQQDDIGDLRDGVGDFAAAHALREEFSADLVAVVGDRTCYATAVGTRPLGADWGVGVGAPDLAYSLYAQNYFDRRHTPTHETGHNAGALHNRENSTTNDPLYPYGYGYWTTDSGQPFHLAYRTVMSYDDGCDPDPCPRIDYFSDDSVTYLGEPLGATNTDNTRAIRNSSREVSFYRDMTARVAVHRGQAWLINGRTAELEVGGAASLTIPYGTSSDTPVMGDWDCDGSRTPGVFRGNGRWLLRDNLSGGPAAHDFYFGSTGDEPIVGDWDDDGCDEVGIRRNGRWYLRYVLSGGQANTDFVYGQASDVPVVGDWDGDGRTTIGIRRGKTWHLRNTNSGGQADVSFPYGVASDVPVVGDWNNVAGTESVGVYRNGRWLLRFSNSGGSADVDFNFGASGDQPLAWR